MLDILEIQDGDLRVEDSVAPRAGNILSVQLGDLEYDPTFGVDKKFFLESELQFQNESFKAYCVQRIVEHQVNVLGVTETLEALDERLGFRVGENAQNVKGFVT